MPTTPSQDLCASIADTIKDYRQGEIRQPSAVHVADWVSQFDPAVQLPILREMDDLLKRTYLNRAEVETFLNGLVGNPELAGADPKQFWLSANFLNIQDGGSSQTEMLQMFSQQLQATLGITVAQCGSPSGPYIYLDDIIFTGNRVKNDLTGWVITEAPADAQVHIIVMAFHRGGKWYADDRISKAARYSDKSIETRWWRKVELEDRTNEGNTSDVFRPSSLPLDADIKAYLDKLEYPPPLRDAGEMGKCVVFLEENGRHLLEQEFLAAGVRIRTECPNLPVTHRPLGYASAKSRKTLGFGATLVTFRNCPNNCPLVFWVGKPWYPLFPRKNNVKKFAGCSDADF